jgi:hypothetical protein
MKVRQNYFYNWNKFELRERSIEEVEAYLSTFFPDPVCFDFNFENGASIEIPVFLSKNSEVAQLIDDRNLLHKKAYVFSNNSPSDINSRIDNTRKRLASIFENYEKNLLRLRSVILSRLLPLYQDSKEARGLNTRDFRDLVYCLSNF